MKPSIGRIVHYSRSYYEDEIRGSGTILLSTAPAIITHVYMDEPYTEKADAAPVLSKFADILVFTSNGTSPKQRVPYTTEPKDGHWHWPVLEQ